MRVVTFNARQDPLALAVPVLAQVSTVIEDNALVILEVVKLVESLVAVGSFESFLAAEPTLTSVLELVREHLSRVTVAPVSQRVIPLLSPPPPAPPPGRFTVRTSPFPPTSAPVHSLFHR
jgi:hypothetical protein